MNNQHHKTYLLTGATGVLGGRILFELLQKDGIKIYCLIRDEPSVAEQRLKDMLATYDVELGNQRLNDKIELVYGNIEQPNLGWSDDQYQGLVTQVDTVIHCAAKLGLVAGYKKLATANVTGTKTIVDFCLAAKARLLYSSSYSMVGDKLYESGFVLKEDQYDYGQDLDDYGYEKTKFEGEKMIHQASQQGLEFIIVRPGNIWGDSKTGAYPLRGTTSQGIYYQMVTSLVESGYTFYSTEDFDITPVDYVAQASLFLLDNFAKQPNQTFNLLNSDPCSFNDIVCMLRECGYEIRLVNYEEYLAALQQGRMMRNGKAYKSTFTDLVASISSVDDPHEQAKYDTTQARRALADSGIECPVITTEIFRTLIDYCVQAGLFKSAAEQKPLATIEEDMGSATFMGDLLDMDF